MSKLIKLTEQAYIAALESFKASMRGYKAMDGKISYSTSLAVIDRKATVYFTETAWVKMKALIANFDKEVGWHGVAYRGQDETKDEYYITDILVYPQEVTGATVNTDQEQYEMWLMSHDDEVFNSIRMHGHSHVNMGVTPSAVDLSHQEGILDQLKDDMFYIFMIWNKSGNKTIKIYDMKKNILFETSDITVVVQRQEQGLFDFLDEAKEKVKDKKSVVTTTFGSEHYGYGGYYGKTQAFDDDLDDTEPKRRKGKRVDMYGMSSGGYFDSFTK